MQKRAGEQRDRTDAEFRMIGGLVPVWEICGGAEGECGSITIAFDGVRVFNEYYRVQSWILSRNKWN